MSTSMLRVELTSSTTHFRTLGDTHKRFDSRLLPSMNPRDLVIMHKPATVETVIQSSANTHVTAVKDFGTKKLSLEVLFW